MCARDSAMDLLIHITVKLLLIFHIFFYLNGWLSRLPVTPEKIYTNFPKTDTGLQHKSPVLGHDINRDINRDLNLSELKDKVRQIRLTLTTNQPSDPWQWGMERGDKEEGGWNLVNVAKIWASNHLFNSFVLWELNLARGIKPQHLRSSERMQVTCIHLRYLVSVLSWTESWIDQWTLFLQNLLVFNINVIFWRQMDRHTNGLKWGYFVV